MIKKMVVGLVLVGLVGVLVVGAINRTLDRTGKTAERQGQGDAEQGNGRQNRQSASIAQTGDAPGQAGAAGVGQAQVDGWVQLSGTISAVNADALTIQAVDGQQIIVEGRPWRFVQEQAFGLQIGGAVNLSGFYEGEEFEVGRIDSAAAGQTLWIRDENGRPLWAGRGRQGG